MTKSPVKELRTPNKSVAALKEMIPRGSVVESFLFFAGHIEFALADHDRFVHAHTVRQPVHEFWHTIGSEPERVHAMLTSEGFKRFDHPKIFDILKDTWVTYGDSAIRSALFFLLNHCSDSGLISSGQLDQSHFTPHSVRTLQNYKSPKNFFLELDKKPNFIDTIPTKSESDFLLIHPIRFDYNLIGEKTQEALGFEETYVHHHKMFKKLSELETKWIVVYNHHKEIFKLYKDYNIRMIDKHGRTTQAKDFCTEVVIANF